MWVTGVDDTLDPVLRFTKPTLLLVVKYNLYLRFRAGYEASICHRNRKGAPDEPSKVGCWVSELILLVVSTVDCDKDAQIVGPWRYTNACPSELCA